MLSITQPLQFASHFNGFGQIGGTVVDTGQKMAVDVDHRIGTAPDKALHPQEKPANISTGPVWPQDRKTKSHANPALNVTVRENNDAEQALGYALGRLHKTPTLGLVCCN